MVLLTMTAAIVAAVEKLQSIAPEKLEKLKLSAEDPSLQEPGVGKPISHGQLVDISMFLKSWASQRYTEDMGRSDFSLNNLLRGSKIYIPPPPPKPEPTPEYKALMARLREQEEAAAYERMLNPAPKIETFHDRFPKASSIPSIGYNPTPAEVASEMTYAEVNRQLALIINVLVSIICSAVFIWFAARYWPVPQRLMLSMGGSALVAVAEVAIYLGYIRRLNEAKGSEKKKVEIREILNTWVVEGKREDSMEPLGVDGKEERDPSVRYRKGKHR